jgi:hypothetical protein
MADLYNLSNWRKHSPITLPPTADKWRSFPVGLQSRLLRVTWTVPKGSIVPSPFNGYLEALISTPLGELEPENKQIPVDIKPIQYRLVRFPAAGFDYQLRFKADNSKYATTLTIWEFIPEIPNPNMAPSYNPPPAIPPVSFTGVETRLDDLISIGGQNSAAINNLVAIASQPETATNTNTTRHKINPWSGSIGNHKILGGDAARKFIKLAADPGQMLPTDRLMIAAGDAGRDALPGPEGWQFDYELLPGGYYVSEDEDSGLGLYVWSAVGSTDPIFITLTEGF